MSTINDQDILNHAKGAHAASLIAALCFAKGDLTAMSVLEANGTEWISESDKASKDEILTAVSVLVSKPNRPREWPIADITAFLKPVAGPRYDPDQIDLYIQEVGLFGLSETAQPPSTIKAKSVAIVGAGMSGLLAAIKLIEQGHDVSIFEKNGDVGGTWLNNVYPGCRVDVHNLSYSYSFQQKTDWSENFSQQAEILEYFQKIASKGILRERVSFKSDVAAAEWNDESNSWTLDIRIEDQIHRKTFDIVVFAVGQLNRPNIPEIKGQSSFLGDQFHSAEWDAEAELSGARIGVIGTGASAIQFVPEIARSAKSLTVFQRSAPWLIDTPDYHEAVPQDHQWLMANLPHYASLYRFAIFVQYADSLYDLATCDPNWNESGSVSALNAEVRAALKQHLAKQCGCDADLLKDVTPTYAPGAKRFLRDNGNWIGTLKQSHVALETGTIDRIEPDGVRLSDGQFHELDVIVYGTGFRAADFLDTISVTGHNGNKLHEDWHGDASAYLGLCVPDYPNMFILYGPNTNIVANGSIIFFSECGVNFILESLAEMDARGAKNMSVRRDVFEAFNDEVDEANSRMAWGADGVDNWFKNRTGRVSQNWPFLLVDYWSATRDLDADLFEFDVVSPVEEMA